MGAAGVEVEEVFEFVHKGGVPVVALERGLELVKRGDESLRHIAAAERAEVAELVGKRPCVKHLRSTFQQVRSESG